MKKWIVRGVGLALLAAAGWWLWTQVAITEEQRIRKQLSAMAHAVETGSYLRLEDKVAGDYSDDMGLDKQTLLAAVRGFRMQHDALLIFLTDVTIQIEPGGQKAQAVFIAKVLAKAKGSVGDSEIRADRYQVYFRKTESGWKMTRAESPKLKFD